MRKLQMILTTILICCQWNLVIAQKNPTTTKDTITHSKPLTAITVHANRTNNQKALAIGKVAIPAMDLPQAISVINRQVMNNQQVLRLSDAIRNVNGVYLATTRGATQENFSARGYSMGSNNIYKDGIRINSGAMPETSSLEKVEVLKGSSAVLLGMLHLVALST